MPDDSDVLADRKPGSNNLFMHRGRVVAQPVRAALDAPEPASLRMAGKQVPAEAALARLTSGEGASL
ncbi:MAG: hypothetical protein M3439_03750 [Chloroflexota bacterium]|nr:hypothetical protein [Chloroflexota bacterium]